MSSSPLAFIFPGQGSQKVGMLSELAQEYPIIEQTFAQASDVLGYDLWALAQAGPQESLNLTEQTQPLLLASSVAIWKVWREQGGETPKLMAGHSLGEWSALVCAEVIDFQDAVSLVQLRGKYMQEAVPEGEGAMAAIIGLDDASIIEICAQVEKEIDGEVVSAVNFNSPGQVVIAGNAAAVNRACEHCKEKGAKRAMLLPVSAPFHSSLLRPAADKLALEIKKVKFSKPIYPIVHNVHAGTEDSPEVIKGLMIEQVYHPVRWVECVQFVASAGVQHLIECGPGKVLSGLVKRIDRSLVTKATQSPSDLSDALSAGLPTE